MPNFTSPTPSITVQDEATNDGATVHTLDEHFRVVADGHSIELGARRYRAGERIPLTEAQAVELEQRGGIEPLHRPRRMDLRRVRQEEIQVGRITQVEC